MSDSGPISEQPLVLPKDEVFWGWHDVFLFVSVTVVSLFVLSWIAAGIGDFFHLPKTRMHIVAVVAQAVTYGVSFGCLKAMFQAEYDEPLLPSLHWRPVSVSRLRLALAGLAQSMILAELGTFMRIPQIETPMSRLLSDRPTALAIAILGVTLGPIAEELAFRGLLQPLLIKSIGLIPGILGTSILFGAMHLEQYSTWQSGVLISLAGVGFGVVRHYTGSTQASTIMHMGYNSALFILYFLQKGAHG